MDRREAFERIVGLLNEAMLDDARWPETSALMDEAFGARGNALVFGDERPNDNAEIFFTKCHFRGTNRAAWFGEYFRDYYAEDEHVRRLRALPDAKIVPFAELYSDEERKTSRAYNEFWRRYPGRNSLAMRLYGPGGARIAWGIADRVDGDGWSASRLDMIARTIPHIRQYVRVRSALVDARALGTSVAELLGNARAGVVQLDRAGRIVGANDRALELLRRRDGLADRHGALRAASQEDDRRLQELLSRALPQGCGTGASGSMTVRRPSLLPRLAVHVKPVTNGEAEYRSRGVAALVLIVDPVDRARVDPALVAAALGLTPAQAGIAVLLAEGRAPRRIAADTGRRYSTVRTHLKHIYARLGVSSRQLEVVPLVLALSSLPAPREQGERASPGDRVAGTCFTSRRCGSDPIRAQSGTEAAGPRAWALTGTARRGRRRAPSRVHRTPPGAAYPFATHRLPASRRLTPPLVSRGQPRQGPPWPTSPMRESWGRLVHRRQTHLNDMRPYCDVPSVGTVRGPGRAPSLARGGSARRPVREMRG